MKASSKQKSKVSQVQVSSPNKKYTFDIEKGLEIPVTTGGRRPPVVFPFEKMKVDESFYIPKGKGFYTIGEAIRKFREEHPDFEFTTRVITDDKSKNPIGKRVWRIS